MRLWFCNSYIQAANWWEEAFCTKFALSKLLCTPIEPIRGRAELLMAWQRKLRSRTFNVSMSFMTTSLLNQIKFE